MLADDMRLWNGYAQITGMKNISIVQEGSIASFFRCIISSTWCKANSSALCDGMAYLDASVMIVQFVDFGQLGEFSSFRRGKRLQFKDTHIG